MSTSLGIVEEQACALMFGPLNTIANNVNRDTGTESPWLLGLKEPQIVFSS